MKVDPGIIVLLLLVLAGPARSSEPPLKISPASSSRNALPRMSDLHDRARRLLQAESRAKTISPRVQKTLAIMDFADELLHDPRYATSPTLQQMRGRLTARLRTVRRQTLAMGRKSNKRPKPKRIEIDKTALAQLNAAFNARRNAANLNQANFGRGPADFGPMLVALIQDTISPPSWDVNGGSSTIQYWRPGMALVVRAPQGVHEQIGPVMGQLRRN